MFLQFGCKWRRWKFGRAVGHCSSGQYHLMWCKLCCQPPKTNPHWAPESRNAPGRAHPSPQGSTQCWHGCVADLLGCASPEQLLGGLCACGHQSCSDGWRKRWRSVHTLSGLVMVESHEVHALECGLLAFLKQQQLDHLLRCATATQISSADWISEFYRCPRAADDCGQFWMILIFLTCEYCYSFNPDFSTWPSRSICYL